MNQSDIFTSGEGNAWWQRNQSGVLHPDYLKHDPVLKMLELYNLKPEWVLEIGCAAGTRLAEIQKRYGSACVGVDPSVEAIRFGKNNYRGIGFHVNVISDLPFPVGTKYDLVIVSYVLHWVDRSLLLKSLAEIDRMASKWVILADFLPDYPAKVLYKHKSGVYTYKTDYAIMLTETGLYREVARFAYDHDNHSMTESSHRSRGVCCLLRKADYYLEI